MNVLPILFNSEQPPPADGWYQIVPEGEFPHSSGKVQVVDRTAISAMQRNFKPRVLVDQEHFSYDDKKPSEAYGWLVSVETRQNAPGLWGKIEWTDLGESAVRNKRYLYLSPVWLGRDMENLSTERDRPTRLDSLGLTNVPNIKAMPALMLNRGAAWAAAGVSRHTGADVFGPADAAHLFAGIVNREAKETGRRFEEVWNAVTQREPVLWFAMTNAGNRSALQRAAALLPDSPGAYAFSVFRNRVAEVQDRRGLGFGDAWETVLREVPAFAEMVPVRNRRGVESRSTTSDAETLYRTFWNSANDVARENPEWHFPRVWTQLHSGTPDVTQNILANWMRVPAGELDFGLPNRLLIPYGTLDKEFDKHEGEARRAVKAYFKKDMLESLPIFRPMRPFLQLLKDIRSEQPTWDFEHVWEEMKQRNPDLVKSFVVSLT